MVALPDGRLPGLISTDRCLDTSLLILIISNATEGVKAELR